MDDTSPDVPVCLLSPHPLVLKELRKTVSALGSRIETGRIDFKLVPRDLAVNGAGVYVVDVVDAAASRPAIDALIGTILSEAPQARIVVLAEDFDEDAGCALLGLGVKGLVRYADVPAQLSRALSAVAGGGFWAPRSLVSSFIESRIGALRARHLTANATLVSKRENEVLDAIVENLSNKEIAGRLNITERTVKFHVSNLLAKFRVGRRSDLILLLSHPAQLPVH
jgi:DNA-binding NarL/FixJ family response regulator